MRHRAGWQPPPCASDTLPRVLRYYIVSACHLHPRRTDHRVVCCYVYYEGGSYVCVWAMPWGIAYAALCEVVAWSPAWALGGWGLGLGRGGDLAWT